MNDTQETLAPDGKGSAASPGSAPFTDGQWKPLPGAGRYRLTREIGVNYVTVYQVGDEWFGRYDESTVGQQLHWWPFSERGEWERLEPNTDSPEPLSA